MADDRPRPKTPDPKRPYHVAVAIGLTTSVYAISLLATTTMQIDVDRARIADRAPVSEAIEALDRHRDEQSARLLEARLRYQAGSDGFYALVERLSFLDARLEAVGKTVGRVQRLSDSLPTKLSLPSIPQAGTRGSSPGYVAKPGQPAVKLPAAPPPKAKPPPTDGSTGGSGKG